MDRKVDNEELQSNQAPQNEELQKTQVQQNEELQKAQQSAEQQDYYVDPLNQDAVLKQHQIELEEQKKAAEAAAAEENSDEELSDTIRPDLNVNGFFSTENGDKKHGLLYKSAGKGLIKVSMLLSLISTAYSVIYLLLLVVKSFDVYWLLSWVYGICLFLTLLSFLNGLRSTHATDKSIKHKAAVTIFASVITIIPLIVWVIHYFITTF